MVMLNALLITSKSDERTHYWGKLHLLFELFFNIVKAIPVTGRGGL
jgi:hypothetical protein